MNLRLIDSHTGGEPTRLVVEGLPDAGGSVHDRLRFLRDDYDHVRRMLCHEPKGTEIAVGAALFPSSELDCQADVVFFNNTGYLGMCGHGTIGVMASLAWMGRVPIGTYRLNTVAGIVSARLHDDVTVSFDNVPSKRHLKNVEIGGKRGDVAYGGNWFFLTVSDIPLEVGNIAALTEEGSALMDDLWDQDVTGEGGARIDHIEFFGPSPTGADSRSFVLCPGKQFDRSPCGTGTSAKLACLFEDGKLRQGQVWRQESIIGSVFEGSVRVEDKKIIPTIKGSAFVTADVHMICDDRDPFVHGFEL